MVWNYDILMKVMRSDIAFKCAKCKSGVANVLDDNKPYVEKRSERWQNKARKCEKAEFTFE